MKYVVNGGCIGCGLCTGICPAIFSMTDDGIAKAVEEEVNAEYEVAATEAREGCPVSAIEEA